VRTSLALVCVLLAACASPQPRTQPPEFLFDDRLFSAPSTPIVAGDVFALSDSMKRYLRTEIRSQLRTMGPQQGLIDALTSETSSSCGTNPA
jgi:hypothetical protein